MQLAKKRAQDRAIGRTKGGLNSKLHAVCNSLGMPILLHLTAGNVSDYRGARHFLPLLSGSGSLLGDRGYDADWFRDGLKAKGISPCIPPMPTRKRIPYYDKELYKRRHKIENSFSTIKDWRRIAMRYDRCAHTFFSAICIASSFIFYLK